MTLTGVAELPLHTGHVPAWLARYMRRLAEAIVEAVVELYSPEVLVERLSDPIWFQAFNNAIGMDWDSSGSTTVTIGILKQVAWSKPELGIAVLGGKGEKARLVPLEAMRAAEEGLLRDTLVEEIVAASRLAAKTDNVLLADGYSLYHHAVIAAGRKWAIVQQGVKTSTRMARRYHWLGPLRSREPSLEPHNGIASSRREESLEYDLTSKKSLRARKALAEIVSSTPTRMLLRDIYRAYRLLRGDRGLDAWLGSGREEAASSPVRYYRPQQRPPRHIEKTLARIREVSPSTIEELVMLEGVGPATVRSLVLVAELVYGIPVSHEDPANTPIDPFRYAYIAGGKDGVPFPFRKEYADAAIRFLREVVREARLDEKSRRRVLARLERLARSTLG